MTKEEIGKLLAQIKIMYPRFDSVNRSEGGFDIHPAVIDAWHQRIGWMDFDQALRILDRHMESEEGSRVPTIALWMNNGKAMRRGSGDVTATLDRRHGVILWQPEKDGPVYERPVSWDSRRGCHEDSEGYDWVTLEEL